MMRFYNQQHRFYCGVDLHARTLSLHILDAQGKTLLAQTLAASPDAFLHAVAPFRDGLVVACECLFAWYWLADLCTDEGIPFVLGHALYRKAIHGGKAKTDQLDAQKIAALLRGGLLPQAYVYPRGLRATRDLLRRRAAALVHLTNTNSQYHLPPPRNWPTPPTARSSTCRNASPTPASARTSSSTWPCSTPATPRSAPSRCT